jgi:hypothetical protein
VAVVLTTLYFESVVHPHCVRAVSPGPNILVYLDV